MGKVIVAYLLAWASAFVYIKFTQDNATRLVVNRKDYDYICTPYKGGRSCKPTGMVVDYILHNAKEDCH